MAKSKSAAKRKRDARADAPQKQPRIAAETITPPPDSDAFEPKNIRTIVSEEELEITTETLVSLAQYPSLIKSKACKDLRAAVYDFRQVCLTGSKAAGATNLTGRISEALTAERYVDARVMLAEMRVRGEEPKLGALCRWVRELDATSALSKTQFDSATQSGDGRFARNNEILRVLDSVMRLVGSVDANSVVRAHPSLPVAFQEVWNPSGSSAQHDVYESVLDQTIFDTDPASVASSLRVIETTPGHLRKPPNQHDAILYTSAPGAVPLSSTGPAISRYSHPHVPSLNQLTGVLSPTECKAIVAAGEAVNFVPDTPVRESGNAVVLAHNFYWVIDNAFHDKLWSRIVDFMPPSVDGRPVRGLNRRFRVYRYVPGAEYRCHIDGAWPPSGIRPDDSYVYDDSPADKKQSSLFTFLMYLNDEFEGGETTFFLPAAQEGVLNAYPVRPVMGGACIFPHGETRGALLHEGTGVKKGAKYIIRSDIEYDVLPPQE